MGTNRAFLLTATASAAIRIPAFVYPIAALRILGFDDYVIFAAHYVFAGAIAAFLGEAVAATVSRTAAQIRPAEEAVRRIGPISLAVVITGACVILAGVELYLSWTSRTDVPAARLVGTHQVALLSASFFLNPPLLALANIHGSHRLSATWAIASALLVTALPLLAGRCWGLESMFLVYGVLTLALAALLFLNLVDVRALARGGVSRSDACEFVRSLGPITFAMALGGPIHGFCLFLLARSEGGLPEMAIFSAYYPWSILIAFFAGVQSNFVISRLSIAKLKADADRLRRMVLLVLYGNLSIASVLALVLYASRAEIFAIYGTELPVRNSLFALVLGCGVAAAAFASTSQIIISFAHGRYVTISSIVYAVAYCSATAGAVVWAGYGAEGLAASLLVCLTLFVALYGLAIFRSTFKRPLAAMAP